LLLPADPHAAVTACGWSFCRNYSSTYAALLLFVDLQAAVVARGWSFCRIDGSMSSTDTRLLPLVSAAGCCRGAWLVLLPHCWQRVVNGYRAAASFLLQAAVVARGWSFCRIDGSMSSTDARQAEVERFQATGSSIPVFLLTTQVGRNMTSRCTMYCGVCSRDLHSASSVVWTLLSNSK
jgi:hypothetical protein